MQLLGVNQLQQPQLGQRAVGPQARVPVGVLEVGLGGQAGGFPGAVRHRHAKYRRQAELLPEHPVHRRRAPRAAAQVAQEAGRRLLVVLARAFEVAVAIAQALVVFLQQPLGLLRVGGGFRLAHLRRRGPERQLGQPLAAAGTQAQAFQAVGAVDRKLIDPIGDLALHRLLPIPRQSVAGGAHVAVELVEGDVHGAHALHVAQLLELHAQVRRQRLVDDQARPVVGADRHAPVQIAANPVQQRQRVVAAQQPGDELLHQQLRAGHAERELRRHDERNAGPVQHVRHAGAGDQHRAGVAAVAGGQRHHGGPMDAAVDKLGKGAREAVARDDFVFAGRGVQLQAIRAFLDVLVGHAMGEQMDVGVVVLRALLDDLVEARVAPDGQQAFEVFTASVGGADGRLVRALQIRPDRSDQRLAVAGEGAAELARVGRDEQDARLRRPMDLAVRCVAGATRDDHRHARLQREPAFGPVGRADRNLRQLEGQQGQLGRRQHQPEMHQGVGAGGVGAQRARQTRYRAEHAGDLDAQVAHHRAAVACVFVDAHLPQSAQESLVLEGHVHDAGLGAIADAQVGGQRRQELIVRGPGAQQLDLDRANLNLTAHRGMFLLFLDRRATLAAASSGLVAPALVFECRLGEA